MKKVIVLIVAVMAIMITHAATVAWTAAGMGNYSGSKYCFFVIGQNEVDSIDTIIALLDKGADVSGYAFGTGLVAANGSANNLNSGKNLAAGTYTSFMVLFDSADPSDGSKYVLISGNSSQTQNFSDTSVKVTFVAGNISSIVNNAANWKSYGTGVPEPTSGLLLLVGGAMLALRRKQR